jgi:LTXXQ motif family protein
VALKIRTVLIASAALGITALLATAAAQPYGPGAGIMVPGMISGSGMMGPWMMGRRGFGGTCNPAASGFAEWRTDRLAELLKLTDAQRGKFDEFKAASIKSGEVMRNACQTEVPETIVGRTEAMEKRMDTMLQSIRTMRPALEAFYATLGDEQKSRLDSNYGRGRFGRWRDRW